MIELGVKVEFPRGFDPTDELNKHRIRGWAPARGVAVAMAAEMRRRVKTLAKTPDRFNGYVNNGYRVVAAPYALTAEPDWGTTPKGAKIFSSSSAFHTKAGVRPGTFDVTGGMWSGLSVLLQGSNKAKIAFRSRSRGEATRRRQKGGKNKGKLKIRAQGWQINNVLKAWSVFDTTGVNVVRNTGAEFQAMATAVNLMSAKIVGPMFGGADMKTSGKRGPSKLVRDMVDSVKRNRRNV